MRKLLILSYLILHGIWTAACSADPGIPVRSGADRMDHYLPLIAGKQIALVANHTLGGGRPHLVDTLLASGIEQDQIAEGLCPRTWIPGRPWQPAYRLRTGPIRLQVYR